MGTAVMLQDNAGVVKITIILSVTVQVVAPGGLKNKHFQEVANGAVFMVWVRTQYFGKYTYSQSILMPPGIL